MCAAPALACLDEAPTFAPRGQIPPFIIAGRVDPPLGAVYAGPIPFTLTVPFRSEDVNEPLLAIWHLDLAPGSAPVDPAARQVVEPGVFEEAPREVTLSWVQELEGCHSITLILTYDDNLDSVGLPRDEALAARVVWWLDIADVNDDVTISSCPGAN